MSEDPLVDCPKCFTPNLKKIISAVAFRLKGGGWYETDFKSGQKKNLIEEKDSIVSEGKGADKGSDSSGAVSDKPATSEKAPAAEKSAAEKPSAAEKKSVSDSGTAS